MATTTALRAAATGQGAVTTGEKPRTIQDYLKHYQSEIARALPKHMNPDRLARIALTEFRKTPALMKCDPASLFGAVIQCAQIGLEPGGALGHAYLIPFENRKKGITEVQFIVGYRGMIDLARRSGQIISLSAQAVYEGDVFECALGLEPNLHHVPDWNNPARTNPAKLRFVYAVAKLKDGGTQFEVMSRAEIEAIRGRSRAANSGPWVSDFVAMSLKTVIRRLFKYLPVSIEVAQAVAQDERAESDISQDNGYVIDGNISEPEDAVDIQVDANASPRAVQADDTRSLSQNIRRQIETAQDIDTLDVHADLINELADDREAAELRDLYRAKRAQLAGEA